MFVMNKHHIHSFSFTKQSSSSVGLFFHFSALFLFAVLTCYTNGCFEIILESSVLSSFCCISSLRRMSFFYACSHYSWILINFYIRISRYLWSAVNIINLIPVNSFFIRWKYYTKSNQKMLKEYIEESTSKWNCC